jgi:3-hydroxymyristoyl/3-hydroxydecanoyl-(acyl carrier protein) dehydratase
MGRIVHISSEHPAFEGHFPGAPLLPGVVLLDELLSTLEGANALGGEAPAQEGHQPSDSRLGVSNRGWTISSAKFLHPVRPGDTLTLEHESLASGAVRFTIRSAGRPVASGTLVPRVAPHESHHGHQTG